MDLELTRIFVKVAQNGSFTKAAHLLKLPKSTVSKAISRLENVTGTKLIMRTTRSLTLTPSGRAFYEVSLGPIQTLEDAQKSLYGQDNILTGHLRITAPEDLGVFVLAPLIAKLSIEHPGLTYELHYTDEVIDLVKDGFDLALRIGRLSESSFKVKRAGEVVLIAVASPQYLKQKERIKHPKDLVNHHCLSFSDQSLIDRWTLKSSKGTVHVQINSRVSSNQMSCLLKLAIEGGGVAFVPSYLCQPQIDEGSLVDVLPEWSSAGLTVSIITPHSTSTSARLKITVDHIFDSLKELLKT